MKLERREGTGALSFIPTGMSEDEAGLMVVVGHQGRTLRLQFPPEFSRSWTMVIWSLKAAK